MLIISFKPFETQISVQICDVKWIQQIAVLLTEQSVKKSLQEVISISYTFSF